jgi:hypothetical protein
MSPMRNNSIQSYRLLAGTSKEESAGKPRNILHRGRQRITIGLVHAVLMVLSILFVLPLVIVVSGSLSAEKDISLHGYSVIPLHFTLTAYQFLLQDPTQILEAYGVSITVTVVGSAISLLVMALLGYVISRRDFKYRRTLSYSAMLTAMHNYVSGFMTAAKAKGVTPTWVQIGNEENSGICHPVGSLSSHPDQLTGLLNTAYSAIKATFPSTQVIVHLAQPQKIASIENFLDTYKAHGGKWDITGFSSYGSGTEIPGIIANMATIKARYGKPVIQVEFGGPVSEPAKVEKDLETYITGLKGFGGLGLFYWEPEGYAPFTNYTLGAWNSSTKRPTAALNGFLNA